MTVYNKLKPIFGLIDPESANKLTISVLSALPERSAHFDDSLASEVAGIRFPSPVGLAPGADKNARAPRLRAYFGYVEVGTVTPRPQFGNPEPRVFRLPEDDAVINRMGFPNEGMEAAALRLEQSRSKAIVGVNIGANKDSPNRVEDYVIGYRRMRNLASYVTVNISSPNTPGLRDLQGSAALDELLAALDAEATPACPLFLKVAPDLSGVEIETISEVCLRHKIDALIVGNTTTQRPKGLLSENRSQTGGLSGRPLAPIALSALKAFRACVGERLPLIGVGGISSGHDAYERIKAGASLIQVYTAFTYLRVLPGTIHEQLVQLMRADGLRSISDAVGVDAR